SCVCRLSPLLHLYSAFLSSSILLLAFLLFFFFNDTAPPEIYPLSLHDALPICCRDRVPRQPALRSIIYREITFHAGRPRRAAPTVRSSAQVVFKAHGGVGFFVAIFDDDRRVERQPPRTSTLSGHGARPRNNDSDHRNLQRTIRRSLINLTAHKIINRRRTSQYRPRSQHRTFAHDCPFINSTITTNQHIIFNNHRHRTHRLQHATNLRG